jgi:hypothetical protein
MCAPFASCDALLSSPVDLDFLFKPLMSRDKYERVFRTCGIGLSASREWCTVCAALARTMESQEATASLQQHAHLQRAAQALQRLQHDLAVSARLETTQNFHTLANDPSVFEVLKVGLQQSEPAPQLPGHLFETAELRSLWVHSYSVYSSIGNHTTDFLWEERQGTRHFDEQLSCLWRYLQSSPKRVPWLVLYSAPLSDGMALAHFCNELVRPESELYTCPRLDLKMLSDGHVTTTKADRPWNANSKDIRKVTIHEPKDWLPFLQAVRAKASSSRSAQHNASSPSWLEGSDFLAWEAFLKARYPCADGNGLCLDIHGNQVHLQNAVWLNFGAGVPEGHDSFAGRVELHPQEVWVRFSFSEALPWVRVPLRAQPGDERLGPLYSAHLLPLPLSAKKQQDLLKFLPFLPAQYHAAYLPPVIGSVSHAAAAPLVRGFAHANKDQLSIDRERTHQPPTLAALLGPALLSGAATAKMPESGQNGATPAFFASETGSNDPQITKYNSNQDISGSSDITSFHRGPLPARANPTTTEFFGVSDDLDDSHLSGGKPLKRASPALNNRSPVPTPFVNAYNAMRNLSPLDLLPVASSSPSQVSESSDQRVDTSDSPRFSSPGDLLQLERKLAHHYDPSGPVLTQPSSRWNSTIHDPAVGFQSQLGHSPLSLGSQATLTGQTALALWAWLTQNNHAHHQLNTPPTTQQLGTPLPLHNHGPTPVPLAPFGAGGPTDLSSINSIAAALRHWQAILLQHINHTFSQSLAQLSDLQSGLLSSQSPKAHASVTASPSDSPLSFAETSPTYLFNATQSQSTPLPHTHQQTQLDALGGVGLGNLMGDDVVSHSVSNLNHLSGNLNGLHGRQHMSCSSGVNSEALASLQNLNNSLYSSINADFGKVENLLTNVGAYPQTQTQAPTAQVNRAHYQQLLHLLQLSAAQSAVNINPTPPLPRPPPLPPRLQAATPRQAAPPSLKRGRRQREEKEGGELEDEGSELSASDDEIPHLPVAYPQHGKESGMDAQDNHYDDLLSRSASIMNLQRVTGGSDFEESDVSVESD